MLDTQKLRTILDQAEAKDKDVAVRFFEDTDIILELVVDGESFENEIWGEEVEELYWLQNDENEAKAYYYN